MATTSISSAASPHRAGRGEVVLLGDHRQLGSVSPGGRSGPSSPVTPMPSISSLRTAARGEPTERLTLDELRAGIPTEPWPRMSRRTGSRCVGAGKRRCRSPSTPGPPTRLPVTTPPSLPRRAKVAELNVRPGSRLKVDGRLSVSSSRTPAVPATGRGTVWKALGQPDGVTVDIEPTRNAWAPLAGWFPTHGAPGGDGGS